ncbi:charged multivesicular body protein 6 [Salvelinus sp. IW2-2015]|uniref:charged multivesicular body protein 6 n=1 Tax=Salvelinus sp. IW2-2015 TaxID=2691554 RepID=UPI0038D3C653
MLPQEKNSFCIKVEDRGGDVATLWETFSGERVALLELTEQDRAILQLKQQRDKLKHYQKRVTLQLEKERSLAKQLLKDGKKEKALVLLKRKRLSGSTARQDLRSRISPGSMVQDIEFCPDRDESH